MCCKFWSPASRGCLESLLSCVRPVEGRALLSLSTSYLYKCCFVHCPAVMCNPLVPVEHKGVSVRETGRHSMHKGKTQTTNTAYSLHQCINTVLLMKISSLSLEVMPLKPIGYTEVFKLIFCYRCVLNIKNLHGKFFFLNCSYDQNVAFT